MFAVLAGVSMLATQLIPAGALAATYSAELQEAYNWAYSKGVTTMSPIDNANMYGAITRSEMAKMLSVYATEVLGMTPDTSAACTFSDIASVNGDLHDYIIESCQLGIMGQGITAFRPYDTISRAEFGTALSRVLWGNQYEGGTPYYAKHLDALKAAGIMTQIANAESTKEIRGYVMLMLMRSDSSTPSICEDTDVKVICAVEAAAEEYKDCPVACRAAAEEDNAEEDAVVKSGDLAVKSSAAADRKVVVASAGKAVSDLDTLTFRTSEEVTLNKVVLEKYGYASGTNLVSAVWLEDENGSIISNTGSVNAKGLVTLSLKKDYKAIDGTLNATIVLETKTGATVWGTIGFKVKDVTSSAANVDLGDYKAYTYDVVAYDGTQAEVTGKGWDKSYNYAAGESYEVAKFKVKAPQDSSIVVKGFTLENNWAITAPQRLDINKFFDKITVKVDWKEVKATASTDKKGELSVSFKDEIELSAKQSVEVVVLASLSDDFDEYGKAIHFSMTSSGLSASDKNDARITVAVSAVFMQYIFNGGKVKLTNNKLGNVDSALNSVDVKIAEWNITVSEAVEWTVTVSTTSTTGTVAWATYTWVDAIESIRLVIGNDEFDGSISNTGLITFSNVEIAESGKVKILVDLKEDVEYEKLSVSFGALQWALVYSENTSSTAETNGAITVSKLNFTAPTGALKNNLTSKNDAEFRNNDYTTLVVFDGTYTAKKQDVELKEFSIVGNNLPLNKSDVKFYVTVGDAEWEDDFVNGTTTGVAEGDLSDAVLVKVGESVKVKVEAAIDAYEYETVAAATAASATCTPDATSGALCAFPISLWSFTLTLKGEDMNGNEAWEASRKTVNLSIVKVGSVEIEATTAKTVLRKAADQTLAAITVRPDGASEATIEQVIVSLTGTDLETLSSYDADQLFALYVDDNPVDFIASPDPITSFAGPITLTAEWLSVVAKSAWVEVKVELLEELAADIFVNSIQVNQTTSNKEFRRLLLPAIVKITNQSDDGLATTFTLWVEKSTSDHIYNVAVSTGTITNSSTAADWKVLNGGDEVTNWVTDEVLNGTASYYVTALRYCTSTPCTCDALSDNWNTAGCVVILKSDFNDFFRVGSTYARINKARDN